MTRPPHVRPVSRAAKVRWAESHPGEPKWRLAVGLVGMLLVGVAACVLLPVMAT